MFFFAIVWIVEPLPVNHCQLPSTIAMEEIENNKHGEYSTSFSLGHMFALL